MSINFTGHLKAIQKTAQKAQNAINTGVLACADNLGASKISSIIRGSEDSFETAISRFNRANKNLEKILETADTPESLLDDLSAELHKIGKENFEDCMFSKRALKTLMLRF